MDSERLLGSLEKAFVIYAFILYSGAGLTILSGLIGGGGDQTDPVSQVIFLLVYVITVCLIVVRRRRFTRVVRRDGLLWLLIGIALLSVLWSAAPDITLRRSIALLGTTSLGVYLVMRFNLREQLRLLAWSFGIGALLSLLFPLSLPAYGLPSNFEEGGWHGVYGSKNILGSAMALAALVFIFLALCERKHRWVGWTGFGLSVTILWLSNSKTALVVFLTILPMLLLYRGLRWPFNLAASFLIAAALVLGSVTLLGLAHQGTILGLLNREATLTGRTEVWSAVIDMIWKRPWLGYGYEAFWLGWEGPSAYVSVVVQFAPSHAHNGFLNLWVNLGLLGLVVFMIGFLRIVIRAVSRVRLTQAREDLWPLTYLTYMLLFSLTESPFLTRNSITWVLYVAIALSMPRAKAKKLRDLESVSTPK